MEDVLAKIIIIILFKKIFSKINVNIILITFNSSEYIIGGSFPIFFTRSNLFASI
jgi:hypothetical protein